MGIEPNISHAYSKHGKSWFERPYMYLIKLLFYNIIYHSYRILFIAVSIKNIVDMSGNKQFVKTRAQPHSHVAVAKTRSYGTLRAHGTHRVDTMPSVPAANVLYSTYLVPSFSETRGSLNFLSVHSCSQNLLLISCMSACLRRSFNED